MVKGLLNLQMPRHDNHVVKLSDHSYDSRGMSSLQSRICTLAAFAFVVIRWLCGYVTACDGMVAVRDVGRQQIYLHAYILIPNNRRNQTQHDEMIWILLGCWYPESPQVRKRQTFHCKVSP